LNRWSIGAYPKPERRQKKPKDDVRKPDDTRISERLTLITFVQMPHE